MRNGVRSQFANYTILSGTKKPRPPPPASEKKLSQTGPYRRMKEVKLSFQGYTPAGAS